MKKRVNILVSGLIILSMVMSSTGLAFAGETGLDKTGVETSDVIAKAQDNSFTETYEKSVAKIDSAGESGLRPVSDKENMTSMKANSDGSIDAVTLLYSTTSKSQYEGGYLSAENIAIIPVKVKNTGIMYMDATVSGGYGEFYLCESLDDINLDTGEIKYYDYIMINSGSKTGDSGMPVAAGNTYYIAVYNAESAATIQAGMRAYVYTTISRTLPQGTSKWTLASGVNKAGEPSSTYFKVKPDRTGAMSVSLNEFDSNYSSTRYVTLYNSNKKALSNEVYYSSASSDYKVYFGVKKNTTYYLKVTDCYGNVSQNKFGIRYGMTSYTDRALGSKSSAKKLARKASATNTLFTAATSNSTDWYKISVTSKRKTVVRINTAGIKSGNVYVTVYRGSKKVGTDTIRASTKQMDYAITYGTTYGKADAGTYYIKLVKGTTASGKYTIRYVQ